MTQIVSSRDKNWSSGSRINKYAYIVFFLAITAFLIGSCNPTDSRMLPDTAGRPGEVVVVMSEEYWESEAGEILRDLLSQPYEMLPQYEPMFDYFHVAPQDFKEFLLLHRNIVLADINPAQKDSFLTFRYDQRAHNQLEIMIKAHDLQSFINIINDSGRNIPEALEAMERKRLTESFVKAANSEISAIILNKHGVSLVIPDEWSLAADTTGFTWLLKESGAVLQGVMVYSGITAGSEEMTGELLVSARDSILKIYMPGSSENSYMTTEKEFPPSVRHLSLNSKIDVTEMRGLWKTVNGVAMGGPFMSISFPSSPHSFTTVEGFVFAAGTDKRDYMRETEAIVLSLELR